MNKREKVLQGRNWQLCKKSLTNACEIVVHGQHKRFPHADPFMSMKTQTPGFLHEQINERRNNIGAKF